MRDHLQEKSYSRQAAILIISESARSLVAACVDLFQSSRCSLPFIDNLDSDQISPVVLAIDHFADLDTQEMTAACVALAHFEPKTIQEILQVWEETFLIEHVLIGSGCENAPDLIFQLNASYTLLSNDPSTFQAVSNPRCFLGRCTELQIPTPLSLFEQENLSVLTEYPDVRWLVKQSGESGGRNIHFFEITDPRELAVGDYLQMHVNGESGSCVFLADGENAEIVGLNKTWTRENRFDFAGVASFSLEEREEETIKQQLSQCQSYLDRLVPEWNLKGLNGLDYIVINGLCLVLEINPRPPASFDLQAISADQLLRLHMQLCLGMTLENADLNRIQKTQSAAQSRAKQVIYAEKKLIVNTQAWPKWATDIPKAGSQIACGEPVCSVYALAETADSAMKIVHNREREVRSRLD